MTLEWTKVNEWHWPLIFTEIHVLIWLTASTNFDITDYNSFWEIDCFTFSPYKSIGNQIWPCRKMSRSIQGHHLNILGSTHAPDSAYKASRSSTFWLQRRDFFKVFTIYGHGGHLGHVTWTIWTNFCSPIPRRLHMKFGFKLPSGFRGEDVWKCWQHTYIRTTEAYLYYKLTNELSKGSGELKKTFAPSQDSDQPGHLPSLTRVFTVCMKEN